MSTDISGETIENVKVSLGRESTRDWSLVTEALLQAAEDNGRGRQLKVSFLEEAAEDETLLEAIAEERRKVATEYHYPVPGTGPTLESSLRIVRPIVRAHIFSTNEWAGEHQAYEDQLAPMAAEGEERSRRLWEKGVLRIFDQHEGESMWSVDFDARNAANRDEAAPADAVG